MIKRDERRIRADCWTARSGLLLSQGIGDESLTVEVVGGVEGFVAGFFLRGDGGVEFIGSDLFCGGVDETELAGG